MNDVSQLPLKYVSPYQVYIATSISRDKLANLINLGILKAKRVDPRTVLIEWDSVARYLDSLPDVAPEVEALKHEELTLAFAMQTEAQGDGFIC
jgi:hypothetical protein